MFPGPPPFPDTGFLDKVDGMAVSGHGSIYGGEEGLRHHLCVSHNEHLEEGASRQEMEERHEGEHSYGGGAHRGEWGCYEHDPSEEPTELSDMHDRDAIGEIHRGIGVSLPDELHRFVHDPSRPAHERARALMDHVSDHPEGNGHLGTHWTTENGVAEDFAETAAGWKRDEDDRSRPEHDHSFGTHEEEWEGETERTRLPKPGTAVVFHAHQPPAEAIDRNPHRYGNGDVYGYSEHGEREVPVRSSHDLDLRGISWAQVHHEDDPEAPFLTEYAHHDFGGGHHEAEGRTASLGEDEGREVPAAERTESVRHMLDHYKPYDFPTWQEVSDNSYWHHPVMRAFVDHVREHGVQRPIPVDYEQDPPQVRNGHTRLLAAERAGVTHVPTRQWQWMDPDDEPDLPRLLEGHQPKEAARGVGDPSGDYKDSREAALLGHFEAKIAALPKSAMAWVNQDSKDRRRYTPISVRHAGFAGLVGDQEHDDEMRDERGAGHDSFDEDLYDEASPEPTDEEQAHYEMHGEHPESYYERHDQAYADAVRRKQSEDDLDHDDPDLMRFVGNHGSNSELWHRHGTFGLVDVRRPVYATQSHVAKEHVERYLKNPKDTAWHTQLYGDNGQGYLGDEHPMFVTHEGRLHATEGHHRTAAALVRGDSHVHGWHFDLDRHPEFADMDETEVGDHLHHQASLATEAADADYRGQHQGPDADDGEAMHEVGSGKVYPADIHQHPDWYIEADGPGNWDSWDKVRRSKDWPSRRVTMYRSMPSPHREVNTGDWVTSSPAYAREHGRQSNSADDWPVVKFEARADQLRTAGDSINEWSYHGPPVNRALVHFSGGANHRGKGPRGGKADALLHEHEPPEMNAAYNEQNRQRRERLRAEREQREASVQHHGAGETAPEGHQIWAEPHPDQVSPVAAEVRHNMMTREPADEHGSNWYHGVSYHGPYHVIRHPQTRQVWVVDRHGRDANPTGGHYGNPERDGNWGEHQAWAHQHGLESAGPEAHRFGTPAEPKLDLMNERTPEFPHSRVDPEDEERVRRPEPRVHAPEGVSPSDEYHGSYEVVRHPETSRYHVVDNAGRSAHVLPLDGFGTQFQAERSRDYTEKRQQSKENGRALADRLYEGGSDALDPGGTAESRQSEENIRSGEELMTRYHGGKGQFKFEPDEEGGAPYYEREHHHANGQPSGWYVKHKGSAPRADVYHRATGDEAHDTMWMDEDEHGNLPDTYGEHDLEHDLREWHDRPDGMRRHLEEERPEYGGNARIQRWKRQHLGSVPDVVAHFEAPAGEDELPPDPGTAPVPEGHVRLWHYTPQQNIASIREHGLLRSKARSDVGNGDLSEPSAGVWASTRRPADLMDHSYGGAGVVEFHAHPDEISGNAESPWHALNRDRTYDQGKLRDWASGHHHVIMRGDVPPEHILAVHEPWHHAARYMRDTDPTLAEFQWVKGEPDEDTSFEPYKRGLRALERGHQREASMAVFAALANPHTGGQDWFHGSPYAFSEFGEGSNSPLEHEGDPDDTSHWNTLIGNHFAASHRMAEEFSKGEHGGDGHGEEGPAQNVVHARLELRNPRVYASEHDMDQEAYEHEFRAGNHHENHHEPGELEEAREGGWEDELPRTYRYAGHGDRMRAQSEGDPEYAAMGHYHPYATRWLSDHPDKFGIAQRFRSRLEGQGHDGIVYGNEFEKHHGTADQHHVCAIPFHAAQVDVTQRHTGPDCIDRHEAERQWPGRNQPMLPGFSREGGIEVVAHFAEPGSPIRPGYQQKLFHVQPDPALNTLETGRHNPEDPLARVRHRQETEEGYVPPVQTWDHPEYGNRDDENRYRHPGHGGYLCHACTQNEGEAAFHDDPEESERHETTYTDWDEEYPRIPATVHRGLRIDDDGSEGRHHMHMLRDAPAGEPAARSVLHHLGDFGTHWTGDEQQARHYAGVGTGGYRHPGEHDMNVVVHARKPAREDIETDPETLAGQNVFGIGYHDDEEIPLREGAPVHVTGVSWKFHDDPESAWRRHDFGESAGHTAAIDPRSQHADIAQSMLAYDKDLSGDDRAFIQSAIDHIRRGAPASEPIDADDAERMARGMRARDRMEQAGWTLGPGQDKIRYGRGFTVNVGGQHRATLSPNTPSGWHVRTHPADYGSAAGHLHHDLDVRDEDLPAELSRYYEHPQIRGELAAQRAEMIAEGRHEAALTGGPDQVSAREERGDRWHDYQSQSNDHLHRGIIVALPDHIDGYVHDESVPREQRAAALQQHFADSGEGLGTHWTPHPRIAQRAIWNAASGDKAGQGAYSGHRARDSDDEDSYDEDEGGEVGGQRTEVMFHVRRPGERNRLPQREHEQYGIGWSHSPDEDEFPLRPGSPLRLAGISWKRHEPQYPNEPFEHHDFDKPVRHVSSVIPAQEALPAVVAHFGPPGHFDYYHGEGSEDGRPRTTELEEHLYGGNHGRSRWDTTLDEAIPRAQHEAYAGEGTNTQKRARYHQALEGMHQHEHDEAMTRAHQYVQHGGEAGHLAERRRELEEGHHQQWQDEWEQRGRHQEDVREHLDNGQAHMHGRDVPFDEMQAHLQNEHGIPSHGLPEHRLPNSDYDDPYQRSLEDLHEQHHGDMGSYRHGEEAGGDIHFHGQYLGSWDAEHHLVNHHGYDIDELRRDEPDLEAEHNQSHERDEHVLSHPSWGRMDEEGHLEHHEGYHDDFDRGRGDDAFEYQHQQYVAPPRSSEELAHHLFTHHSLSISPLYHSAGGLVERHEQSHADQGPEIRTPHQHNDSEERPGHDPVFGSRTAGLPVNFDLYDMWMHLKHDHGFREEPGGPSIAGSLRSQMVHDQLHEEGAADHHHEDPASGSVPPVVAHFAQPAIALIPVYDAAPPAVLTPLDAVTGALRSLGAWEPQGNEDAVITARALPEVFLALRDGLAAVSAALSEMPVHPAVRDAVAELAVQAGRASQDADDLVRRLPPEASWQESGPPNR